MAAMDSESPLTPEREEEVTELQKFVDSVEEPFSGDLSAEMEDEPAAAEEPEKTPTLRGFKKEAADGRAFAEKHGAHSSRENEAGYMTRYSQFTVMPVIVNQRDKPTCAYVTLAKTLVYNLIGIMMDIEIPYAEKVKLNQFMKSFQLDTTVELDALFLRKYKKISKKGYIVISLFFYFFHWIRRAEFKPHYLDSLRPSEVLKRDGNPDVGFEYALRTHLYPFLKLTIERLGGITFAEDDVVLPILRQLRDMAGTLEWKRISLCTLNNARFSRGSPTFHQRAFGALCRTILDITRKGIKIYLTLFSATQGLHDVMLAGIEGKHLLISNSWGHTIDVSPIELLPKVSLKYESLNDDWLIFQFTFLLPIVSGSGMLSDIKSQYDLDDFGEFRTKLATYNVPTFTKLVPTLSGGTRKRRNKTKRHIKKSRSRL
jgi:hypothetical protein